MSENICRMENYFVIGGGTLQKDFVELVKSKGYVTHVFDFNPQCICAQIADVFHCISIDAKEEILEIARKYKPVAVQTVATELGNITACYVGEKLGLRNCSYQTSLATTDKSLMKEVFEKDFIPTARSFMVSDIKQVDISSLSFPVVVKSSDRSAGRGVSLAKNETELKNAFKEAYAESNNKIVLIEEYLQGQQYSVETISYSGEHQIVALTEEYTTGAPDFIECYHLIPARLQKDVKEQIEQITFKILEAFKIQWGSAHIELMLTENGVKIIEVASRMGGLRDKMITLAKDINYLELIFNSSIGVLPKFQAKTQNFSIVKMILDEEDYQEYLAIKESQNCCLKIDDVNQEVSFTSKARSLMDAQGFYYLQLTNESEIEKYLK